MRIRFHRKLDDLKERLLVMAGMAEQAIQRAVEAYRVRDISLCDLVVRSEISINNFEREIDQMALDLLAMEQPMAIDLRFILAVIKINADLERVRRLAGGVKAGTRLDASAIKKLEKSKLTRIDIRPWVSTEILTSSGMRSVSISSRTKSKSV